MEYEAHRSFAQELDQQDPLRNFRSLFHLPRKNGSTAIYFCGNSLGLQPVSVSDYVTIELEKWRKKGVAGHFEEPLPWVDYHQFSKKALSRLVGADQSEVVTMNNLTTNLHLLLASFYQPSGNRVKIMIEAGAFPSDHYAVESHMRMRGINPENHLVCLKPVDGDIFYTDEITEAIHQHGEELALVMFPGIQYYTGQFFDMNAIAAAAHECGAFAGFDLAHAIGNVPMHLHEDRIDFATWCSYKYLNSGPGGVSGVFVHEKHSSRPGFPKLTGWWGHEPGSRFEMDNKFVPAPGVDAWMLSNPNILSTAAHHAALDVFEQTEINQLREKSMKLTGFMEFLIQSDSRLNDAVKIITPVNPENRGCQLSFSIIEDGKEVHSDLMEAGVIVDWREPSVIRAAPAPLYNTFEEVYYFYEKLKQAVCK